MATVRNNILTQSFSGALGDMIVFRQLRGKTIVAKKGEPPRRQSAQQRENRSRFKEATLFAKAAMLNPERKAYYWRKAKKLNLPNAYTAAITDFMRKGEIKAIDAKPYKGKAGNTITIKASKKDFALNTVSVSICDAQGTIIESAAAIKKEPGVFMYKASQTVDIRKGVTIRVMLTDRGSDDVMQTVCV